MRLLIVRHGEAGMARTDFERPLTESGIQDIEAAKTCLCELAVSEGSDTVALISPYTRTQQTWNILSPAFACSVERDCEALTPDSDRQQWLALLQSYEDKPDEDATERLVIIVSHQPLVSNLVNYFLTGDRRNSTLASLPPGGMTLLDMNYVEAGCATLLWQRLPPNYSDNRG